MTNENKSKHEIDTKTGLVSWFANNHVSANILMLFLIVGGALALTNIRTEIFPSVNPGVISISTIYPGATPYEVEDAINKKIEEAITGIEGIDRITSTAQEGSGTVSVKMEDFIDGDKLKDDVKNAIDSIASFPPADVETPIVKKLENNPRVMQLALYLDKKSQQDSSASYLAYATAEEETTLKYWSKEVEDILTQNDTVSLVTVEGAKDYEISIEISENELRKYNLTIEEVGNIIAKNSINVPAGAIDSKAGSILLRVENKKFYGRDFSELPIIINQEGSVVKLGDIAVIKDGLVNDKLQSYFRGNPAVLMTILRSSSQDTLTIDREIRKSIAHLQLPKNVKLELWESRTDLLKDRMSLLGRNAILGFLLVFLVLLLFLDLKLAFWVSMGIPISFLGGILIIYMLGLSLNMITLFAFIVVLGVVVDDAIVAGESIFTAQEQGHRGLKSSILGVKNILAPVMVGVFTTIAAFAPLAFSTGVLGQIMRDIPIVVIFVLLVSLMEAFFILPAHLSNSKRWSIGFIAKIQNYVDKAVDSFSHDVLTKAVTFALKWRYVVMACFVCLIIVVQGLYKGGFIKFVFFPQVEGDELSISLTMPVGSTYETTHEAIDSIMASVNRVQQSYIDKGKDKVFKANFLVIGGEMVSTGPGGRKINAVQNKAQLKIRFYESDIRQVSTKIIEQQIRDEIGEIPFVDELVFSSGMVDSGKDITVAMRHNDEQKLEKAAQWLSKVMQQDFKEVRDLSNSLKEGKEQIVFKINEVGIANGLTPAAIGLQIRNAFYGYEVQRIQRDKSEVKVMVRYPQEEREKIDSIKSIQVTLANGKRVPLENVVTFDSQPSYSTIYRIDGKRAAEISFNLNKEVMTPTEMVKILRDKYFVEAKNLFPEINIFLEGESKDRERDLAKIGENMLVALMLIFVMLGSQLRSYVQPIIIMMAIPFGILGAVLGHYILGYDLSFLSLFGVVALSGVVVNDSVVLMDYFNKRVKDFREEKEKNIEQKNSYRDEREVNGAGNFAYITRKEIAKLLVEAVQGRFRAILLTTLTTSLGLLPILMETSLQAQFLIPMAVSISCGILFATTIILLLVPILVMIKYDLHKLLRVMAGK